MTRRVGTTAGAAALRDRPLQEMFVPGPGAVEVQLRLGPAAAWVPESVPVQAVARDADGAVTGVVLDVSGMAWFERLLLQLGPGRPCGEPAFVDGTGGGRGPARAGPLLGSPPMGMQDFNAGVIKEFRENKGKVGAFGDAPVVLLHTTGAKSGTERVNPLVALLEGDRVYVVASKGGAPTNPDWYHNLVAHPEVEVELGDGALRRRRRADHRRPERDRLFAAQVAAQPGFAEYEKSAGNRVIPVVELRRT